ncbi:hypothetical protein [Desulfosediminicola ganghwensis]|uniref:hypothetical protein n=1 Tax=Desulfosediminicola ganghwensis TaxID=2569540 RepID=UPI0010AD10ED|nr:hypothetical protein [Desulfosediminicola ganghwensis]
MRNFVLVLVAFIVTSCASIEGLRDKSYTMVDAHSGIDGVVAILPVKETAEMPGLSGTIEAALAKSLKTLNPATGIVESGEFKTLIVKNNLVDEYVEWKSAYDTLKAISVPPLREFSKKTGARYFLLIPSVHLSREKIRGVDTGYTGWVSDTNNVWRTNLIVLGELVDSQTGTVIWRGVGKAEYINSPRRDLDLGLVITHQRNPEIHEYLPQMVEVAAKGITQNIFL